MFGKPRLEVRARVETGCGRWLRDPFKLGPSGAENEARGSTFGDLQARE